MILRKETETPNISSILSLIYFLIRMNDTPQGDGNPFGIFGSILSPATLNKNERYSVRRRKTYPRLFNC